MAKAKTPDDQLLEGLRKALEKLPELLPVSGTKALFNAKQADILDRAIQEGFLVARTRRIGTGKKSKEVVEGLITEAGARKVAEAGGSTALAATLDSLRSVLGKVTQAADDRSGSAVAETARAAMEKATNDFTAAMTESFAKLRADVLQAVTPTAGSSSLDPAPVLAALTTALEKVEPVIVKVAVPAGDASPPPPPAAPVADPVHDVGERIVSFVESWAREKSVGPPFDAIMQHLRSQQPEPTVGNFHEALRRLTAGETPRLKLSGWSKTIHELPEPELALFVKHTVMYHAHPAN